MIRCTKFPILLITGLFGLVWTAMAAIDLEKLESEFGDLQGQMEKGGRIILVFPAAKVTVFRDSGKFSIKRSTPTSVTYDRLNSHAPSSMRTLKRNIGKLPVHEQVRYWRLHQIRYPENDVSAELEASLDRLEEIRKETMVVKSDPVEPVYHPARRYSRTRTAFSPYFSTFGYSSYYRHRRSIRKDTQIELDRIQRRREPVESWTTPMSVADRARSDALSKVSGARSSLLGIR